ncbi:MAG: hypothetical protein HN411_00850 [Waddliaceae bacterium]|jgi:hypothetical protein|nr:hypothetical protein [Waddliaceae bacterium]MBT7265195.1 hypothetical protein [Waddliaceae bacterium]MBT7461603.1 hypothetical protein [Waddliaceae bacterium]
MEPTTAAASAGHSYCSDRLSTKHSLHDILLQEDLSIDEKVDSLRRSLLDGADPTKVNVEGETAFEVALRLFTLKLVPTNITAYRDPSFSLTDSRITAILRCYPYILNPFSPKGLPSESIPGKTFGTTDPQFFTKAIEESHDAILLGARGLSGKVFIPGCGRGMDIPLKGLLEQEFDEAIIADVDRDALEAAIKSLPEVLGDSCSSRGIDISGFQNALKEIPFIFSSLPINSDLQTEYLIFAIEQYLKVIPQHRKIFHDRDKPSYVISSLLLTQLPEFICDLIIESSPKGYNCDPRGINEALNRLRLHIQKRHLNYLKDCVKPGGKIYLSYTHAVRSITVDTVSGKRAYGRDAPMINNKEILKEINRLFNVVRQSEKPIIWECDSNIGASEPSPEKSFLANWFVLVPKP